MRVTTCTVWGFALVLSIPAQLPAAQDEPRPPERAAEIDARCWFNAQPVRLHDPPKLILLEFWSVRSRESRKFVKPLTSMYHVYPNGRLLIVALSEDNCDDVRGFVHREKVPYKVGAESRSGRDYGIKELPAIVLIDPKDTRVVSRWSGKEVKVKAIAKAIQDFLGPPPGAMPLGTLAPEDQETAWSQIEAKGDELGTITSQVLSSYGEIPAEALAPLDRFYEANLGDESEDNAVTRAQHVARSELMTGETGYEKLLASGRLSEAGKTAIRDRVLQTIDKDPSAFVRIAATHALQKYYARQYMGRPADAALLEALRGFSEREQDPLVKASLDDALEDLGPNGTAKRQQAAMRPNSSALRRMLNESPDPVSSPWADAYAYRQTVSQRTVGQLLEDYRAFPDPPDDEQGRRNATLKRDAAMDELENRILGGEVRDFWPVIDHLARVLSDEPDPSIRKWAAWQGLKPLAERGGSAVRGEIVDLLEKRLPVESDRNVKAFLETVISELKGE